MSKNVCYVSVETILQAVDACLKRRGIEISEHIIDETALDAAIEDAKKNIDTTMMEGES